MEWLNSLPPQLWIFLGTLVTAIAGVVAAIWKGGGKSPAPAAPIELGVTAYSTAFNSLHQATLAALEESRKREAELEDKVTNQRDVIHRKDKLIDRQEDYLAVAAHGDEVQEFRRIYHKMNNLQATLESMINAILRDDPNLKEAAKQARDKINLEY